MYLRGVIRILQNPRIDIDSSPVENELHHELVSLTNKMTGSETAGEGRGNFRVNIVRDGRSFPSAYVHIWGQQTERGWSA